MRVYVVGCASADELVLSELLSSLIAVMPRCMPTHASPHLLSFPSPRDKSASGLDSILWRQVMRNLMPKGPSSVRKTPTPCAPVSQMPCKALHGTDSRRKQGQVLLEYAKVHLALDDMVVAAGERPQAQGGFVDMLDPARLASMAALK
jgi:hypothetical protein